MPFKTNGVFLFTIFYFVSVYDYVQNKPTINVSKSVQNRLSYGYLKTCALN